MENDQQNTSVEQVEPLVPISSDQQRELALLREQFIHSVSRIMNTERFDLAQVYPETDNLDELYEQLEDLKKCLDSFRPFNSAQVENLREVYDTEYTYASNRIEGNTLTLRETSFVINEGLTIRNKPMKDHLEAINHKEAIAFMRELVDQDESISERNIKLIHALILQGIDRQNAGTYRGVTVGIKGTNIVFPEPYIVPKMMEDLIHFYDEKKNALHPIKLAAQMHAKLVNIHPFIDGNGRTCRLVMNLILLQNGYPLTIFAPEAEDREAYFDALNQVRDTDNQSHFELFVAKNVKHWAMQYLSMLAPNTGEAEQNKGYYYFKKIEPHMRQAK